MSGIVLVCLAIRLGSLALAFYLLHRLRDWRVGLLSLAVAALVLELGLPVLQGAAPAGNGMVCLFASLGIFGAVALLGWMLLDLRNRGQEAARSEERFRDLVEASSDRYWEMDQDLRFVWARESTEKQRTPFVGELIGKTRWELYKGDPAKDESWARHKADLLARRPFRDFRHSLTGGDGKTRFWSVSGKPVYDVEGNFAGYRGTASDITEQMELQQRAENALRDSEKRLRDFAGVASDLFWETGPDLNFTYVSDQAEEAAEGTDAGRREQLDLWGSAIDPLSAHLKALEQHREFRNYVYSLPTPRGALRHFRVSGRPLFGEDGAFLGYRGVGTEITAEVEAERHRQEAEIRLAKSIDVIPAGFALFDESDRLVICNQQYRECYEVLGVRMERGTRFEDMVWAAVDSAEIGDSAKEAEAWARRRLVRRSAPAVGYEFRHSGTRWSEVSDYILPDGGVITLAHDVTDRKLTEEALRISEQHFRNVVEGSQQGMFILKQSEFLLVNQAYADMLGYTPEEIYALEPPEMAYAPHERERIRGFAENRLKGDPAPTSYEVDALRKDGSIITLHHFAKRAEWYGEPVIQIAVMDITDRKRTEQELLESQNKLGRSQQRLLDAIECLNDAFVLYDEEDRLVLCNSKFNEFYHLSEELLQPGARFEDQIRCSAERGVISDAVNRVDDWATARIAQHQDPQGPFEQQLADGRWVRVNEMKTTEGGTVGIRTDITSLKQAEDAVRQHEAELAKVQRRSTMGEMAAALAHELNQPLTAVTNYSSGCLRRLEAGKMEQAELTEVITTIREQAQRASDVLRHIGGFVAEGRVSKSLVDINAAIRRVMALLKDELRRNEVKVELALEADLPDVQAVQIGIEQVVQNVAMNAIEAMQEVAATDRKLKITTSIRGEGRIAVSVSDSGRGFAASDGEAYFAPFVSTKQDGMGMGLAICRSIVTALGGEIRMKKRKKSGTIVSFALPTADEAIKDAA